MGDAFGGAVVLWLILIVLGPLFLWVISYRVAVTNRKLEKILRLLDDRFPKR